MIIDADTHVIENPDLFDKYLDPKFENRKPRLMQLENVTYWFIDGQLIPKPPGSRGVGTDVGFAHPKGGLMKSRNMKAKNGSFDDVPGRLLDLDTVGVDVQVIFPTTMLGACHLEDTELAAGMCRAYNDYVAQGSEKGDGRLRPLATVPLQDPVAAVEELRRAVRELHLTGVVIPGLVGDKPLDSPEFFQFFKEADSLNVPIGVHSVTGAYDLPWANLFKNFLYTHMVAMPFAQMTAIMTLIGGGILERLPNIRFGLMESGCSWLPFWSWWLDKHVERRQMMAERKEEFGVKLYRHVYDLPEMKKLPSEYIKNGRIFVSAEPMEDDLPWVLKTMGEEMILFATDYPHGDADFPNGLKEFKGRSDITEEQKRKILEENPKKLYNL